MFYIAIMPPITYVFFITFFIFFLTIQWMVFYKNMDGNKSKTISYFVTTFMLISSYIPLYLTFQKSISMEACLTGFFGFYFTIGTFIVMVTVFLVKTVIQKNFRLYISKRLLLFISTIALSHILIGATYMRSILLCTV